MKARILSIDAWRDDNGWTWNNWFHVGMFEAPESTLDSPRKLLAYMRDAGYLSDQSKGRVSIEDDQYNIVICDRNTNEPVFAIEYGAPLTH